MIHTKHTHPPNITPSVAFTNKKNKNTTPIDPFINYGRWPVFAFIGVASVPSLVDAQCAQWGLIAQ